MSFDILRTPANITKQTITTFPQFHRNKIKLLDQILPERQSFVHDTFLVLHELVKHVSLLQFSFLDKFYIVLSQVFYILNEWIIYCKNFHNVILKKNFKRTTKNKPLPLQSGQLTCIDCNILGPITFIIFFTPLPWHPSQV